MFSSQCEIPRRLMLHEMTRYTGFSHIHFTPPPGEVNSPLRPRTVPLAVFHLTSPGAYDSLSLWSRCGHIVVGEGRSRPGAWVGGNDSAERRKEGLGKTKNNTNEATISLKTKKGMLETKLRTNPNEPKLECSTRAGSATVEFFESVHVSAGQGLRGNTKNSGNEAKKLLKTKDLAFLMGAKTNPKRTAFACKKEQIDANKDQIFREKGGEVSQAVGAHPGFKRALEQLLDGRLH